MSLYQNFKHSKIHYFLYFIYFLLLKISFYFQFLKLINQIERFIVFILILISISIIIQDHYCLLFNLTQILNIQILRHLLNYFYFNLLFLIVIFFLHLIYLDGFYLFH